MPAPKLPYPPSPANVPDDLTDYPDTYRGKQNVLLLGLFMFLVFYVGVILLTVLLGAYCFVTLNKWPFVKFAGLVGCGFTLLFLIKGFFKGHPKVKEIRILITEEEQPVLFDFIGRLCQELDAPSPDRVYVSTDVNAAVMPRSSVVNLIVEPKKDLLIGLGLVNCINLSEFKSVMAHEFGHFCQSGYISSYSYVASQIILDIITGEDAIDRFIEWCKRQENLFSIIGYGVGGPLWLGKKWLEFTFRLITMQRLAVSREQEFHADLVAVKAAGSDAVCLSLMRLRFGNLCLLQAADELGIAAEHSLYSRDIFYHQTRAETTVRRQRREPDLGLRPSSSDPQAGRRIRVFDPDREEEEHDDIPEMRRTHPPAHEIEENAKAVFIPAVVDDRSPWILFSNVDDLKERLSYKFYRIAFGAKKNIRLIEPEEVQRFIDDENAETNYDPKYHGIYDGRPLEPGDLAELHEMIRGQPWDDDRIEKVHAKLYEEAKGRNEDYQDLRKEKATLENASHRPSQRVRRKIRKIEDKLDRHREWFRSLDRRVYLCCVQMAQRVNSAWRDELVERYRFGLEIQRFYMEAQEHEEKAFGFTTAMLEIENPHPDLVADFMGVLRKAWKALKNILADAREINMPAMKNFEEGERLADFILDKRMVPEPPLHIGNVRVAWIQKLVDQLRDVRRRCGRLHWKSVGGILALQEKIAAAWPTRPKAIPVELVGPTAPIPVTPIEFTSKPIRTKDAPIPMAEVIEAIPIPPPPQAPPAVKVDVPAPAPARPLPVATANEKGEFVLDLDALPEKQESA